MLVAIWERELSLFILDTVLCRSALQKNITRVAKSTKNFENGTRQQRDRDTQIRGKCRYKAVLVDIFTTVIHLHMNPKGLNMFVA